ncbi:sigma-54 interaction domain-containing protein [Candidatus Riflebacteria bacterium]
MKTKILLTWAGQTDLNASQGDKRAGLGPIGRALKEMDFSHLYLLSNYKKTELDRFTKWLRAKFRTNVQLHKVPLISPTNFEEIYGHSVKLIELVKKEFRGKNPLFSYHLSPGTPAMAAVWIILAKTTHPAKLIESSKDGGVKAVSFPFDLAADFIPAREADEEIIQLTQAEPPPCPEFKQIIYRCGSMKRVIVRARQLAMHDVPVIIQGESGTGKELFARAIHYSSARKKGDFIDVNCGAIPSELAEAEFFGYEKGAFTDARQGTPGYFERADGGTLFLDEIGELPLPQQVKFLRVLQEGLVRRIGAKKAIKIDIRIIAATNRNLVEEVSNGNFRQDLFHRIAVGVLQLPPLRERKGDLSLLIDHFLENINNRFSDNSGWVNRKVSAGAKNLMLQHTWPGNVRELINTLSRAMIFSLGKTIKTENITDALFTGALKVPGGETILSRNIDEGINLPELLGRVITHYLKRALEKTHGKKVEAAKLVGLPNYQTLTNWMKKYDL